MDDKPPLYAVVSCSLGGGDNSSLAVMYNAKRFYIFVSPKDLRVAENAGSGDVKEMGPFEKEYWWLLHGVTGIRQEEPRTDVEELEDWIMNPCLSHFKESSSASPAKEARTLQDYFEPPTSTLKLTVSNGALVASPCPTDSKVAELLAPMLALSKLPD